MEITGLGFVLLPLGIMALVLYPRLNFYLAVFFVPFTASSLINSSAGIPLTPAQYFGCLFILQVIFASVQSGRLAPLWRQEKAVIWLSIFVAVVILSTILPYLSGDIGRTGTYDSGVNLNVVFAGFKGTLVVIFGVVFMFAVVSRVTDSRTLTTTVQTYLWAGVFVSLWAFFEFACDNYLPVDYPAYIFNNAELPSMQGYRQIVFIDEQPFLRVASVAHEPSILAKILISMVPILLSSILLNTPLLGWLMDRTALAVIVCALMITTAATAYFGMLIALAVTAAAILTFNRHLRGNYWYIKIVFVPPLLLGAILAISEPARTVFHWTFFQKISSGSAVERSGYIVDAYSVFEKYPVFGSGWASVTSHDLVVYLLANSGLVGFLVFVAAVAVVGIRSIVTITRVNRQPQTVSRSNLMLMLALPSSLLTLLGVSMGTGLELYLVHFYLILALVMAFNLVALGYSDGNRSSPMLARSADHRVVP